MTAGSADNDAAAGSGCLQTHGLLSLFPAAADRRYAAADDIVRRRTPSGGEIRVSRIR